MLKPESGQDVSTIRQPPITRIGDVAAMIRVMRPIQGKAEDVNVRRRMLADLCKFIGVQLGTVSPQSLGFSVVDLKPPAVAAEPGPPSLSGLPPRLQQTMRHLLDGDSEKAGRAQAQAQPPHRSRLHQVAVSPIQRLQPGGIDVAACEAFAVKNQFGDCPPNA